MPKKRGQGEGSIRQRSDGSWEARYTLGKKSDGTPNRKSVYGDSRQEVAAKLNKTLNDINAGTYVEPTKLSLSSWLDTWFETYKKPTVKAKTLECYDNIIKNHIKPSTIGMIPLKDLRPDQVQKLYNDIAARLSGRMAELTHVTLHAAISQAYKNGLVPRNVTELVTLPKKVKKEPRVLTKEEQKKFMEAFKGDRMQAAFILLLFAGLRRGELLGLRWKDIDFKNKVLKVNHTLCRVKNFNNESETKTQLAFDTPKSEKGKRTIPLLDEVISALKSHKTRQKAEKLNAGDIYQDNGLVFCTLTGTPLDPRKFNDIFQNVVKASGVNDVNIHALRHPYVKYTPKNNLGFFRKRQCGEEESGYFNPYNLSIAFLVINHTLPLFR